MHFRRTVATCALVAATACGGPSADGPLCRTLESGIVLPSVLSESSGVAVSLDHPGLFWSHNDAGYDLVAFDAAGQQVAHFALDVRLRDWEDLALAMCPGGGSCLYLADVGDNYESRPDGDVSLLRIPEPDPALPTDTLRTERFPIRLPDGPRDIEAMVVLPGERLLLITKGRNHPVTVYRYPGELRADTVTLEEVQRLTTRPRFLSRQITGGAVDPAAGIVAIRSYGALEFYRFSGDTLAVLDSARVGLTELAQGQGEGVGIGTGGLVALTAESGPGSDVSTMALLRCDLERFR